MFDPVSLLAAFAPVAIDAGKAVVNRWIAPDKIKPMTVAEAIQLEQVDIDRLKALAELDRPAENISQWVADFRAAMRPGIAVIVAFAWAIRPDDPATAFGAQCVWFYLFGERTMRK